MRLILSTQPRPSQTLRSHTTEVVGVVVIDSFQVLEPLGTVMAAVFLGTMFSF
jgi:hypothetical protein